MAFSLGGMEFDCPPTRENYDKDRVIVSGRQVAALDGSPMDLNVIRKYMWRLVFYPGDQYENIKALEDEPEVAFTDHDGKTYTVKIWGNLPSSGYPASINRITLTLREV